MNEKLEEDGDDEDKNTKNVIIKAPRSATLKFDLFLPYPFQFTHHPMIRCYIMYAVEKASLNEPYQKPSNTCVQEKTSP